MPKYLTLEVNGSRLEFSARRLLAAGYTGRNREQVRAHIEELERQGIPAPEGFPTVYEIDVARLTTEREVNPESVHVSGEAEAVLLFPSDTLDDALISLGVDFTDRVEERRSILRSKQQPKPISARVWKYADVAAAWDGIAVRSWVEPGSDRGFYQSGTLAQLLPPPVLLEQLGRKLSSDTQNGLAGTVLLMGTVPLCHGEFRFTPYFACELETPAGDKLSYSCAIHFPK